MRCVHLSYRGFQVASDGAQDAAASGAQGRCSWACCSSLTGTAALGRCLVVSVLCGARAGMPQHTSSRLGSGLHRADGTHPLDKRASKQCDSKDAACKWQQ